MVPFFIIILFLGITLAQENPCPDYHITQDNRTHIITPEEIRLYQNSSNQRPTPSVLSYAVRYDYNNQSMIAQTAKILHLSLPILNKKQPNSGQPVLIISKPVVHSAGQTNCVQVNCPDSFEKGVICWKCVESTLTANVPDQQSTNNNLPRLTSEMSMIHYGEFKCPMNSTVDKDCMPKNCPSCKEIEFSRSWFIILLIGIFVAGCVISTIIFCVCRKITK